MSGCQVDATDASQIPAPSGQGDPGCSAWRNTDSLPVFAGGPYHIKLNLGIYKKVFGPGPVEINMIAKHVPVEWQKDTKAIETEKLLKSIGVERRMPLYLLPAFRETHAPIDLKPQFKMDEKSKAQGKGTGSKFLIEPVAEQDAPFTISGTVPKETKNGDIILVTVTAKYPGNKKSPAKSIEFLAALHVTNK